jgi:hypothetical protein
VRELSRGGRRKNDVIDAAAVASVTALAGDAAPILVEDLSTVLVLLDERRANLAAQRTRLVNHLHALLRDLTPGGVDRLDCHRGGPGPRRGAPGRARGGGPQPARRDLVAEVREVDVRLARLTPQCRGPSPNTAVGCPSLTASARSSRPGCSAVPAGLEPVPRIMERHRGARS